MIVGIMQPYFFPYLEYFRLIHQCDKWLAFDIAQYTRKSWMNRNRILNREKGWSYVSVPVEHQGKSVSLLQAKIANDRMWRRKLLDQLRVYQHEAPNYGVVRDLVETIVDSPAGSLADLNCSAIRHVCSYLGITTPIERVSEAKLLLPEDCGPGEWALEIATRIGAREYRNPSGGRALFDTKQYEERGIVLSFHQHRPVAYPTGSFTAIADLSVIDVLMWNEKHIVANWLG